MNFKTVSSKKINENALQELYVGQVFNSVKELFNFLGVGYTSKNTKESSERLVQQYLLYEQKQRNHVEIIEIYSKPKPKNDKRFDKPHEMKHEFQNLLVDLLKGLKDDYVTKKQIGYLLGAISFEIYELLRMDEEDAAKTFQVSKNAFLLFKNELAELCASNYIEWMKKLSEKGVIEFYDVVIVDKVKYSKEDIEYKRFYEIRKNLVEELGFKKYSQAVFGYANKKKFHKIFKERLGHSGIKNAYTGFSLKNISLKPEVEINDLSVLRNQFNLFFCQKLAGRIYNAIKTTNENHKKDMEKALDELFNGEKATPIKHAFKHYDSVVNDLNRLLNACIISDEKPFAVFIESFWTPKNTINEIEKEQN